MHFQQQLDIMLAETVIGPLGKLLPMIQAVAADFKCKLECSEPNDLDEEGAEVECKIIDAEGTVVWITFFVSNGRIQDITLLAGPSTEHQWDFPDLNVNVSYDEFLDGVADLELEPPKKDYGIGLLNVIAWVINAHYQVVGQESKVDDLYENGYYRLNITAYSPDGADEVNFNYWVEASSSEDARWQVTEMLGKRLIAVKVIQFAREKPDWE